MTHQRHCMIRKCAPTWVMLELYSITIPSASRAATQNVNTVTATFIRKQLHGRRVEVARRPPQSVDYADVFVAEAVAGADDFAGIFNLSPTLILSVVRLFSERSALTVVPNSLAILVNVSPDLTV